MTQHPAYELFEELGRGTNTVVYRSYDLSLGREVAIKELDEAGRRDARHRERFLREAQFLAQFEHDNVLRVYSVDPERGWIVMELMRGTLASVIADGPSDPDLVRSVLKQTLDALAFLHEKDKVHGTVRPTNLLINDAGRVKLSEFEQTAAGGELRAPKGSKKYLAPELIRTEFGDFGPPLDLYCLGFTALEMLKGPHFDSLFPGTGKGAIDADVAWLRWHSSPDELASTRKLVKGIPDDLAHVLDRMLKKRVIDRPQSAQEVLKELADRPLIAVPVAGLSDEDTNSATGDRALSPGTVRELSPPPRVELLQGAAPVTTGRPESQGRSTARSAPARSGKSFAAGTKPVPPRFSKDWWNLQLGRPYVLWPLCAVILLAAAWFSFGRKIASGPPAPRAVQVSFDVKPDSRGLEVAEEKGSIVLAKNGTYELLPGKHKLTFRKPEFVPLTQEIDVSTEKNKFTIKLEPVIKFVEVAMQIMPPDAVLSVAGVAQTLKDGSYVHKHKEGEPLAIEVKRDGFVAASKTYSVEELKSAGNKLSIALVPEVKYADISFQVTPPDAQLIVNGAAQSLVNGSFSQKLTDGDTLAVDVKRDGYIPVSRSFTAADLAKVDNKILIELERDRPKLPASLVAKDGADLDPDVKLPMRAISSTLDGDDALEFVLVKPGTYRFGFKGSERANSELAERRVAIDRPFYIAIHETTNAQFQRFADLEGDSAVADRWQRSSKKWTEAAGKWPEPLELEPVKNPLPVTNVSWDEAQSFCKWIGGRLPTEIEWESSVRGLEDKGYPLPWGNAPPSVENCRIFLFSAPSLGPVPVEGPEQGASPLGLVNAIGNVAELCQDSENSRNYVLRGSSFTVANMNDLRVTWRGRGEPRGEEFVGFRVVIPIDDWKPNL